MDFSREDRSFESDGTTCAAWLYRPVDAEWDNRCPARVILTLQLYRPIRRAADVDAPVLVIQAEEDKIIPATSLEKAVHKLNDPKHLRYPMGHFDPYRGEFFEPVVEEQTRFFRHHFAHHA